MKRLMNMLNLNLKAFEILHKIIINILTDNMFLTYYLPVKKEHPILNRVLHNSRYKEIVNDNPSFL